MTGKNPWIRLVASVGIALTVVAACRPARGDHTPPVPRGTDVDGTGKTLAQLFEGRPGVAVEQIGSGVRLRIRNAVYADGSPAYPLYVVNDLPIIAPGGVLSLDPADITRIEILKDDASTLIWGERGANGVVKITMKKK